MTDVEKVVAGRIAAELRSLADALEAGDLSGLVVYRGPPPPPAATSLTLRQAGIPVRVLRAVARRLGRGYYGTPPLTVADLVAFSADDLLGMKNVGYGSLAITRRKLAEMGLALRDETPGEPPT